MSLEQMEEIERAKLLVLHGDELIVRQKLLMADLKRAGLETGEAERILRALLADQEWHRDKVAELEESYWAIAA